MKKITLFLMLFCCCTYAQLAEESFEGTWTPGSGPAGWMTLQNGIGLSVTWTQSIAGNNAQPPKSGIHAAYLNNQNVATGSVAEDYLVTAEFTVPQNAELTFWSRLTTLLDQGSIYDVLVANITDGDNPSVIADYESLLDAPWTELEINPDQTDYNKIVVPIPAGYEGKNVRIAFKMAGDDQDRWLIDDVMVQEHCFEPSDLTAGNIGLTTANLSWTIPAEAPDGWEVEIMLDYEIPDGLGDLYNDPLPYPAEGLLPDTDYKYFVRSRCGTDGTSEWIGPFYFTTAVAGETCEAALPVGNLPFNDSGNTADYSDFYEGDPCPGGSTSGYLDGQNVVYAYTPDESGNISIRVSGLTIANPYVGVFVYTACANIGDTCYASDFNDLSASPLEINPLAVTAGTTYYIIISSTNWYMESTLYTLSILKEHCAPPTAITIGAATETSVPLTWTEEGTATSWEYAVTMPGSGFPPGAGTTTTTASHIAGGLQAGDVRDFYVRSVCGDGTFSSWAGPFTFNTVCGTLELPFFEGFNSDSDTKQCWTIVDGNGDFYTDGSFDYNQWFLDYYDMPFEGDLSALFYTDSPSTDDWLISPTINLTGNQRLRLRYMSSTYLQPDDIQMFISTTGTGIGDFTTQLEWEFDYTSSQYAEVLVNLVDGTNTPYSGPVNIGWRINPQALPDGYILLQFDNIIIEDIPDCADPLLSSLEVLSVTPTSAELSWTPGFDETQWYVIIETDGPDGPIVTSELATSLPYTASGLDPVTDYEYYVRSACGAEGEGNIVGPFAFTTACPVFDVPFYEGFNSDSATKQCWTVLNTDGSEQWYSWYLQSADIMFVFEGDQTASHNNDPNAPDQDINDWLISPAINLTGNPAQRLKFHAPPGTQNYELLLSTTGTDPADFNITLTPVDTGNNNNNTHTEYIAALTYGSNNPITGTVYIAWHVGPGEYNYAQLYVDNVIIDTCFQPTGLSAGETTESTAELSWDAGYTETSWQVVVQPKDTGIPTDSGEVVNSNEIVADELLPATHYEYYVRADCGAGDSSDWSGPYYFDTKVCDPASQCNYIFTMSNTMDNGQGWYGHTMSVRQNGFTVATLTGPTLYNQYPDGNNINIQNVEVPLCPGIPFELIWDDESVDYPFGLAVSVYTPYVEHVYTKQAGGTNTGDPLPGDLLYTGMVTCDPAECAKPMNLTVTNIGTTSALLEWDEIGDATSWEVWVLPLETPIIPIPLLDYQYYGYPVPVLPVPAWGGVDSEEFVWENPQLNYQYFGGPVPAEAFSGPGMVVTENPYTATNLIPGTHYAFYVKAICGAGDQSSLSGAKVFTTAITNDACIDAIPVPVNSGWECTETMHGTLNGATSAIQPQNIPIYDVWYRFVAENDIHTISLNNAFGSYAGFELFSGDDCGNLTLVQTMGGPSRNVQNLTIGATYLIRVYTSAGYSPMIMSDFDLCICTPGDPIIVSDQYTMEELVEDFLIGDDCVGTVTNVTSVMGSDFAGNPVSIGYFNAEESYFPLKDGIVLATGDLQEVPGYWGSDPYYSQDYNWPGDPELTTILTDAFGVTQSYVNASVLEFDFTPTTNEINFDFVFASDEYGEGRHCSVADGMAIIVTGPDGIPHNIGVVPGTDSPVSVFSIRPQSPYYWTGPCIPVNEEFFGSYNGPEATGPYYLESEPVSGINHYGQTVAMNAHHDVTAGEQYHVKFVIANHMMARDNSALFISGFKLEETDLGPDQVVANNTALCEGEEITLESNLDPEKYTFEWTNGDDVIADENGPDLIIDSAGDYHVVATLIGVGVDCIVTDNRVIEYYDPIIVQPANLELCNATGIAEFDLSENTTVIFGQLNLTDYTVSYHLTAEQAEDDEAPLDLAYTNTTPFLQPIYVRINNTITGCHAVETFNLVVTPAPQFTLPVNFGICAGTTGTITVTPGNFDLADATYAWAKGTDPLPDTTSVISVTEAGIYTVTVTKNGCSTQASVTINVIPNPVADVVADVTACHSYVLPQLSAGNSYYTAAGGQGTQISAGEEITATQTIYVYAQTGTIPNCTAEESFVVTITASITPITGFTLPAVICRNGTAPVPVPTAGFTPGGTYTVSTGATIDPSTGTIDLTATPNGTYTITYAVAPDPVNCIVAASTAVTVTITDSVVPVTGFDYEEAYCSDTATITPELSTGFTSGGTFAASAGLVIDPGTGIINVAASTPGSYTVTYTIAPDSANCNPGATASETVTLLEELSFDLEGICDGNSYFIRMVEKSGNFDTANFEWVDANGQPVGTDSPELNVTDLVNGTSEIEEFPLDFMLTVINNGCEKSEVFSVDGISCFIQRGISPNNDGNNDTFDLSGLDVKTLSVFNRYGMEVYKRNNYVNEWGGLGNVGNELPTGTYFYIIALGNGESRTGWIYINREE